MSTYEIPVDVIKRMGNGDFESGLAKLQAWAHQADRRHIRKLQSIAGREGRRISTEAAFR